MPTPRENFATAVSQNRIYCIGGSRGYSPSTGDNLTGVNEVYDPATDTWETKNPMPTPRRVYATVNVIDGKIYVIGGYPNSTLNEVYDPETDTWTTRTPMPIGQTDFSGIFKSKIYFFGGYYDRSKPPNVYHRMLTQIYDPATDTWSSGTPPPLEFYTAAVGVTTGVMAPQRMYVFSGGANQVYNPETDSWVLGTVVPTGRGYFSVAVVDDFIYVIGGTSISYEGRPLGAGGVSTYYATVEVYTPFGYGTVPPEVSVVSPDNGSHVAGEVQLNFTVNRRVDWIGYSLDGEDNVTITGNVSLRKMFAGPHNVTVYAKDEFGNIGASETITFDVPGPFPIASIAVGSIAAAAVVCAGIILYLRKKKQ
jgi:hypothetical protein